MSGLIDKREVTDPGAVLNGIAYDSATDRLFVTGKLWPKLFEIKLTHQTAQKSKAHPREGGPSFTMLR